MDISRVKDRCLIELYLYLCLYFIIGLPTNNLYPQLKLKVANKQPTKFQMDFSWQLLTPSCCCLIIRER